MTDLVPVAADQLPTRLVAAANAAHRYLDTAYAPATRAAYQADLDAYEAWCAATGLPPTIAPHAVALFAASLADAGRKRATVDRAVASLGHWWRQEGHDGVALTADPVLGRTLRGIRRSLGSTQKRARPVMPDELRRMVAAIGRLRFVGAVPGVRHCGPGHAYSPDALANLRAWKRAHHRALLVVMFCGALRVSEALSLDWSDVETTDRGLLLTIRRSKTDQLGAGMTKALPPGSHPDSCPVRALAALHDASVAFVGFAHGPVFDAAPRTVLDLVRRTAELAGLDGWQRVSTHSLRAGLATSAAAAGKPLDAIMRQTGHKSVQMVLRYVRPAELWRDNAAAGIGL